jgi:hypothetical protein
MYSESLFFSFKTLGAGSVAQAVECLLCKHKHKAMNSNPSLTERDRERERERELRLGTSSLYS